MVRSSPLTILHKINDTLKGILLRKISELKWFLFLFFLILFEDGVQLKLSSLLWVQTTWSRIYCCRWILVDKMLAKWYTWSSWVRMFQFHCLLFVYSAIVVLLSIVLLVENWANGPSPSQLSTQNDYLPKLRFHWICYFAWLLFVACVSKSKNL